MDFHQTPIFIVYFLVESYRFFFSIHFFHIPGAPAISTLNLMPISPAPIWQRIPVGILFLIFPYSLYIIHIRYFQDSRFRQLFL